MPPGTPAERTNNMREELIAANLATVEAHFHSEAANEVEQAVDLYTDDIVWESPNRNLIFHGKEATAENYRRMFGSFRVEGFRTLERFATEERVVDDSVATVVLTGDGVANAPVPVGSRVEIRLLHVFEMRAGKIARELVFENWRVIQPDAAEQLMYGAAASLAGTAHPAH
jgi:ketosteroid isomerase-like protein